MTRCRLVFAEKHSNSFAFNLYLRKQLLLYSLLQLNLDGVANCGLNK